MCSFSDVFAHRLTLSSADRPPCDRGAPFPKHMVTPQMLTTEGIFGTLFGPPLPSMDLDVADGCFLFGISPSAYTWHRHGPLFPGGGPALVDGLSFRPPFDPHISPT
ncbi:uncharacterized protein LOC122625156 isoform X1 [Drosophila teissieri]|uniref:uncharacterized protein LOC122625156 isoform X1 n=1 Tax=Drosophila teissieri TaxID=7243 RepID=UPI001CBA5A08|nr:uncharacterized protein LOC122625156 isoform X1 [Drosophila teissieri]